MSGYFGSKYGLSWLDKWLDSIPLDEEGDRKFPSVWNEYGSFERQGKDESNADYFKRVADDVFDGRPKSGAIEESLLVLLFLSYDGGIITKLNVEAFVAVGNGATLKNTSDDNEVDYEVDYLRMDYDIGQPGPLFGEPQPHIHIRRGAPRLALTLHPARSLLASFFDAVYRSYLPNQWHSWCRGVWQEAARRRDFEVGLFDRISEAYKSGNVGVIRKNYDIQYTVLKQAVNQELNGIFDQLQCDRDELSFVNLHG